MSLLIFFAKCERRLAGDASSQPICRSFAVSFWFACVCGFAAAIRFIGFPVIWEKLGDIIVMLDAGWRIWNGQVPHRDFYSVIGPFPLGVFASGYAINHRDITGYPMALLLTGIILSVLSWLASKDRLTIWWRLMVALQVLLLPPAMIFLGGGEDLRGGKGPPFDFAGHIDYAMQYNRLGWAVLLIQMLIMLIPQRSKATPRQIFQDAILAGAMMGLGIFCKISYLLGAVGLGVWWIALNDYRGRRALGLCAGLAVVTALLAIYPGGVFHYFVDQWSLLHVRRAESHLASLMVRVHANLLWLLLFPILHLSVISEKQIQAMLRDRWYWSANFVVAILVTMFVTTFNTQRGEVPTFVIVGLITIEMILRANGSMSMDGATMTKCLALKICCAVLAWSEICYDGGSIAYAAAWKLRKPRWADESEQLPGMLAPLPVPVHFDEPTEKNGVEQALLRRRSGPWVNTGVENYMTSRQVARWTNDGVELLHKFVKPTDRIFVAAWMNPFDLALGLPPAKGGAMHWDWDRVVDVRIHPDVQQTLADVTIFMVPKRADWTEQRDFMLKTYGQGLGTDFHVAGESQFWTCWSR